MEYCFNQGAQDIGPTSRESTASLQIRTRHYAVVSSALDFIKEVGFVLVYYLGT